MSRINDIIAAEAEAIENAPDPDYDNLPDHVTVSRPGFARSTVLSVRFNNDVYERMQHYAERKDIPLSTLVRAWAEEHFRTLPTPEDDS